MKNSYLVISSFTLMLFALAGFINRHYILSIVSLVLAVLTLTVIIIIKKGKVTLDLLDLAAVAMQFILIGIFVNQLKEISVNHVYVGLIITLFNLIYHKATSTLSAAEQRYCYVASIMMLSAVFVIVALADFILVVLFSFEALLIFNYLAFLFVISFPTLLMGLSSLFQQQPVKA